MSSLRTAIRYLRDAFTAPMLYGHQNPAPHTRDYPVARPPARRH